MRRIMACMSRGDEPQWKCSNDPKAWWITVAKAGLCCLKSYQGLIANFSAVADLGKSRTWSIWSCSWLIVPVCLIWFSGLFDLAKISVCAQKDKIIELALGVGGECVLAHQHTNMCRPQDHLIPTQSKSSSSFLCPGAQKKVFFFWFVLGAVFFWKMSFHAWAQKHSGSDCEN